MKLLAFIFRRALGEAVKDGSQFGLFGTYARAASAANPGHWGGGGAAAPGTHVELRTDKTGRAEHRTVKDSAPPAAPQKAKPPMQLGIFGGETPEKRPAPLKVVGAAPQRARLAVRPACSRCGQTIPRLDPHADGKTCGACLHTIDWVHEAGARPALSGSLFG